MQASLSMTSVRNDEDTSSMTDKDLELYKLYRAERETPPIRGVELLKSNRHNKVSLWSIL